MTTRGQWKLLRWAVRIIGCLATVGIMALALSWALERGLSSVYGDAGMARALGERLALSVLLTLALLALATLTTKRVMNTERWREALRWTAVCAWQGARLGLIVFVAVAAAGLLVAGLIH